jgi:hypothetical protein
MLNYLCEKEYKLIFVVRKIYYQLQFEKHYIPESVAKRQFKENKYFCGFFFGKLNLDLKIDNANCQISIQANFFTQFSQKLRFKFGF